MSGHNQLTTKGLKIMCNQCAGARYCQALSLSILYLYLLEREAADQGL